MDPTNNLVPDIGTTPEAPALESQDSPVIDTAALEAAMSSINPASDVANAAMNGATPVVTTTDDSASDVAPAPTLQISEEPAEPAPAEEVTPAAEPAPIEGPVNLAPSAEFQMNVAPTQPEEVLIGTPVETPVEAPVEESVSSETAQTPIEPAPADYTSETPKTETASVQNENEEPIVAAAPVPGSIGSAKSYADIQRAEAERAAKMATKSGSKIRMTKNTIILIIIAAIAVIATVITMIIVMGGNTPSNPVSPVNPTPIEEHEYSTLSCKRNLAPEEYLSYGATKGTQENVFYFVDDELDGLKTNFAYTYANQALATIARDNFKRDYGVVEEPTDEDSEAEREEDDIRLKTTAEMLHHYVEMSEYTVTHGMEVKSEDIKDWLESDAYSDVTYGAVEKVTPDEGGEETEEEIVRNLKYYNKLQNSIDYTCSISKGD